MTADIRDLHARAISASVAVVSQVSTDDLDRATPCEDWNLGALLAHMTVQHHGFAAAAEGNGGDPSVWDVRPLGADPVGAYVAAAGRVVAAFVQDGVPDREFALPEISPLTTFPGSQAIGFHLVDYVVHGWDVARSIEVAITVDQELLDRAVQIALSVPDGPERGQPGAAFEPARSTSDDAPMLDRIVALLGRSPTWPR